MGCNLSCSWCDTPYTWDGARFDLRAETTFMRASAVVEELRAIAAPVVVITGGEPLLHQHKPAFRALVSLLQAEGREVHIETNGTRAPSSAALSADAIAISPKQAHAGPHRGHQDPAWAMPWVAATRAHPGIFWKLVVREPEEVRDRVRSLVAQGVPRGRLWFMPEGTTADELAKRWPAIAETAAELGANASHRLHVLAWGEERGR